MHRIAAVAALILWALPLQAEERVERLIQAMQFDQVIAILREEGKSQGREMDEDILNNTGGPIFAAQVERIYDPVAMRNQVTEVFTEDLTDSQLERAILFFESDLGQTIVSLENSARKAFADETIEEMARDAYRQGDQNTELFRLVEEYIQVNDLIEQNVQSSLSADFSFFRGLNDDTPSDDAQLLAGLLAQKDSVTAETKTWLYSFLLLAYQPLNDTQMRENIAFSRTETGKAVNEALFEIFDRMYGEIYFKLGQAVSQVLKGSDL